MLPAPKLALWHYFEPPGEAQEEPENFYKG